ncbi:pectinesterase-like protein [Cinnamomum micranthum f. kanehirae]|uniref:Pectinesterase-like protein n=1 Tax=Cinnamomum micranthum f. kanehirae TaxID=337451 RepID=A0A3S3N4A7_9MAGN|nr:pectinesterase-like protein [Cinnamomum micranthum f. kanehirae]
MTTNSGNSGYKSEKPNLFCNGATGSISKPTTLVPAVNDEHQRVVVVFCFSPNGRRQIHSLQQNSVLSLLLQLRTHVSPVGEYFPSWVSTADRKLVEVSPIQIKPHNVVAKDGSGHFYIVQEAITAAPDNSTKRFVIYVKKGIYEEKVEVGKKNNITIFGDGMDLTTFYFFYFPGKGSFIEEEGTCLQKKQALDSTA